MDEKKGISLRKKRKDTRPLISAPKPQSSNSARASPEPTSRPRGNQSRDVSQSRPQQRSATGDKTSEMVKRRYSTRFTQFPGAFNAAEPPVPSLPSLPKQYASNLAPAQRPTSRGTSPSGGRQGIPVDLNALRDPNLRPETYVASILADASESEVRDYQQNLQRTRNRTSTDLQQNVYQNRTQFIKISREAEQLKGEMRTLRNLMAELKANTSALDQASSGTAAPAADSTFDSVGSLSRKHSNRSSVANLEAMWNTQLQTLWKNVEGSQKFLPAAAGRHVVRDSPHWVELNAATWKGRRAMHMFLLNDHLLVASRKKKRVEQPTDGSKPQPAPSKLVAERCWPLLDIQLVDLSTTAPTLTGSISQDPSQLNTAITIRIGSESFTYRNDKPDGSEKTGLLLTFRKASDELRKQLRAETDDTAKAKDTAAYLTARDPALLPRTDLVRTLSGAHRPNILIDVDGKQQNLRWVESQMDELDIAIALQRFDDAVERVERLRKLARGLKSNALAQDLLTVKADERATQLADVITRRLVDTPAFVNATARNVGWLTRLGFDDRAREAFLEARSAIITKRTRQVTFTTSLQTHTHHLSFVTFTLIANTVRTHQACFPPVHMSAVVKWAASHVETFNAALARQLKSVDGGGAVPAQGGGGGAVGLRAECVRIAREHAAVMVDVGLDFKELVAGGVGDGGEGGGDGTGGGGGGGGGGAQRSDNPVGLGLQT
ncbi:MAG: exocyst complex component exo84 [Piccolia ochrophora]|nr:MAG: exocyst complex component exo84 [Piccolia ochrophora]